MSILEHSNALPIFQITDSPRDHPGKFVVRLFYNDVPTANKWVCNDLEQARVVVQELHPGAFCMPRFVHDDPVIVEVWL